MKKMSYLHFPGIKSFCISFNDLKSRRYTWIQKSSKIALNFQKLPIASTKS